MSQLDLILNWVVKNGNAPKQTKEQIDGFSGAASAASGDFTNLLGVVGSVTAAVVVLKEGFEFAEEGAQIQQLKSSFDLMNESVFKSPDLLDDMSEAVRGTVAETDLMRGLLTLTAGASDEMAQSFAQAAPKLLEIAKASNKLNPSLGDTAFLYESLSLGIKRNSPLILDNLGIVVKVGEANEKYAAQIGKTVEALTAEEKSTALLNATLESGNKIVQQAGGNADSAADSYAEFRVILAETTTELKLLASEGLAPVIPELNKLLGGVREFVKNDFRNDGAVRNLKEITKAADGLKTAVATAQFTGGAFGLKGLEQAGVDQFRSLTVEIAKSSDNLADFAGNLQDVFGANYASQLQDVFDLGAIFDATKVESNVARLQEIAAASDELAESLIRAEAPIGANARAMEGYGDSITAGREAHADKLAEETRLLAEANEASAQAALDNTAALEAQAAALAEVSAKTGDYYTTIASGDGVIDLAQVAFEAADAYNASALQLAVLDDRLGITEDASKSLGGAIASTIADLAGADFAQTGNIDVLNEQLARASELASGIDLSALSTEMRNRQQAELEGEESPFAEAFEPSAALAAIDEVTAAGVQGFGEIDLGVTTVTDSAVLMNEAISAIPLEPIDLAHSRILEFGGGIDTSIVKIESLIERVGQLAGAVSEVGSVDVGGDSSALTDQLEGGGFR